jgi:CBS domain containing-hemolysin-like protein
VTGIVLVGGITLLASFLCSLFEAALYSTTPVQVEVLRKRGTPSGVRLARLREDVEGPIAAILTVNTIAHTVGAAWCGAMVGEHYGSAAVGIFAALFTVLVLALTEIIPKSIGVRYAAKLGPMIVWPLQLMIWSVWPIVWLAERAMRLLTGHAGPIQPSEEEIVLFSRIAERGGSVRREERRWVENALRLDRVSAEELRTPRTVVNMRSADEHVGDAVGSGSWSHSRVPLTDGGDRDRVIGLVHTREVFAAAIAGRTNEPLRNLMHPIEFVPEKMRAHELLNLFLEKRKHMVAVADEYGGFEGVVTLEDVLECLLGRKIVDEADEIEDMRELALQQRASLPGGESADAEREPEQPEKKG